MVEYSRLTPEVRDEFLRIVSGLAPHDDVVLLDTGAGISDIVLFAVSLASEVLMIATPEPTSLTDAYATIKVLVGQQQRQTMRVIANQTVRQGAAAWPSRISCNRYSTALSSPSPTPLSA